jgi:hypothetical protein
MAFLPIVILWEYKAGIFIFASTNSVTTAPPPPQAQFIRDPSALLMVFLDF